MKKKLIYIIFCILFHNSLFSQNAKHTFEQSFNKAYSYHYTNQDSAYFFYEKTIQLADQANNIEYLLYTYQYLINANGYYYDLKNYQQNLRREDSLLSFDKRIDTFAYKEYFKDYLLFDKGNYNYKIKQYTTSKKHFKELLLKINKTPLEKQSKENIIMLSSIYAFLGEIYRNKGKYQLATNTLNKAIGLLDKYKINIPDWESRISNNKKLLAQIAIEKEEFQKANQLLNEPLTFYKTRANDPSFKNNLLSTYLLLEKNAIKQGEFHEALQILNENSKFYPNENPFERDVDLIYGDAYLGLKNYKKAENYYKKSLYKTKKYRNNKKHQDIAIVYARLGNLFLEQLQFDKGLQQYQQALIQLEENFNSTNLYTNPNSKKTISKLVLMRVLKEKLDALYKAYLSTTNLKHLKNAHQTSKTIIKTLDELRPEFESKLDKQFLIHNTYPSIQKMVTIAHELYEKTKEDNYIDDAFFFMEKSKSILLLETIRNAEATKYGNIPEVIINNEQQFRATISHIEQEIFNKKTTNKSLTDSLSSIKETYYNYLAKTEKEYPKYYDLKYKTDVVSLNTIQQQLGNDQAVLSYLVTEKELYLTLIDTNLKTVLKLPYTNDLQKTIQRLYRKSSNLNIEDTTIFNDSYAVYEAILKPALQKTKATDLLIIADDLLHYVPFDALVTSAKKPSYLLKTHSISYASSATLLQEHNKKQTNKNSKLLVFAPQFNGETAAYNQQRADMSPLLYNQQEAQQIAKYFTGKIFSGNQASIKNFNNAVVNYSLLHFATHASANDKYPDYSYLAFSNDSTASNLLYVKDLYNYTINADLVTLSACQTGIGKLQKGEGMLSLARAFNYAGASAIVTTLWKINDQSTSEIMANFYKNLSEGLSKKEALRQAKLTYLETNDDPLLNHPYYWSGIVLTGNTIPVVTTNYLWWILWSFLGVLCIWMMLSFLRNRLLLRQH